MARGTKERKFVCSHTSAVSSVLALCAVSYVAERGIDDCLSSSMLSSKCKSCMTSSTDNFFCNQPETDNTVLATTKYFDQTNVNGTKSTVGLLDKYIHALVIATMARHTRPRVEEGV